MISGAGLGEPNSGKHSDAFTCAELLHIRGMPRSMNRDPPCAPALPASLSLMFWENADLQGSSAAARESAGTP